MLLFLFIFSSPTKNELLPPLEDCLAKAGLPAQLSHLRLSRSQSNSTPSTPEMRVHRQLSLRYHSCRVCICSVVQNTDVAVNIVSSFVFCTGYPAQTPLLKGIAVAPEVQGGDWQITQSIYQRLPLIQTMGPTLDLRIATLNTRMHLTTAPRVKSCPISLHSHTPALLAAMDLQPSLVLAFTIILGISQAPISTEAITMKKWSTLPIWTWHGVITPSKFNVLPTDTSILSCPITEVKNLYLQTPGCPPPHPSTTLHTIVPAVSRHKWWMNSSSRGIDAVSSNLPGPVLLTDREPSGLKTCCQARSRPTVRVRSTMSR